MAFTVADGLVRLVVDEGELERSVSGSTGPAARAATRAGQTVGSRFSDALGKVALAGGAAAGAAFAGSIRKATGFEEQLRVINTVAKVSDEALRGIGEGIIAVSKETGKATDDLTAGFYDLVSAGVPAEEALSVLKTSAVLATGALGTTGEAVDLLTSTLNAYGLEADQATRVSDVFAQAVADGKVTVAELGASIANIAPIASSAGISIEEVAAGFAIMTSKGAPATQAATQMRAAIAALLTPNEQMNELQTKTGQTWAELAREKGLSVALGELREAAGGNEEAFAKALGSVEAYQFALAATGENAEAFAAEQKAITDAADEGGVAMSQYEEVMKSAAAQGRKLAAEIGAAAITIGGPFVASLGPVLEAIGPLGSGLTGIASGAVLMKGALRGGAGLFGFAKGLAEAGKLGGALQDLVLGRLGLVRGLRSAASGLVSLAAAGLRAIPALFATGGALHFMLGPIGLIVLAVGALFIAWETNFLGIRDLVGNVVAWVIEHFGFLEGPINGLVELLSGVLGWIGDVVAGIAAFLSGSEEAVAKSSRKMRGDTKELAEAVAEDLEPPAFVEERWRAKVEAIGDGIRAATPPVVAAAEVVADTLPTALEKNEALLRAAADRYLAKPVAERIVELGHEGRLRMARAALEIASGLRDKRSSITAAFDQLREDMKNRLTPRKEVALRIGQLFSKQLARGLKSADPVIRAQAEGTRGLIEDQLIETIRAGGKAGKKILEELEAKMKSKDPAVRDQAKRTKGIIDEALKKQPPKTPGEAIGQQLDRDLTNAGTPLGRTAYGLGRLIAKNLLAGVRGTGPSLPRVTSPTGASFGTGPGGAIPVYAEGTGYVPSDLLAYLHEGEMVVPRRESDAIRSGASALARVDPFGSGAAAPNVTLVMPDARNRDPFEVLERARRLADFGAFSSRKVATVAPNA